MSDDGLRALILISKVTGLLSMGGTSFMMYEILSDKKKLQKTYFRLMLAMSFIEFTDGLVYFMGSWFVPEGFLAAGNNATCTFQGFLVQSSIGSTLYNAFLSLYYLLSIKYNWSERLIAKKVEPWMHGISLSLAYGTAIAGAALGIYVSYGDICYIGKIPFDCLETYQNGYTTCIQGDNSSLYLILFFTIWQWSSVAFTAASMLLIWWHIRQTENRMNRYNFGQHAPVRKNSRRFAKQGLLYVLVFYWSHFFATILIYYLLSGDYNPNVVFFLRVMYGLTYPLEGFLNFLVYMRPRMIKKIKKRKEAKRKLALETHSGSSDAANDAIIARERPRETARAHVNSIGNTDRKENEGDAVGAREEASLTAAGNSQNGLENERDLRRIVEEFDEGVHSVGGGEEDEDPNDATASSAKSAKSAKSASSQAKVRRLTRFSFITSVRLGIEVTEDEIIGDEREQEELDEY